MIKNKIFTLLFFLMLGIIPGPNYAMDIVREAKDSWHSFPNWTKSLIVTGGIVGIGYLLHQKNKKDMVDCGTNILDFFVNEQRQYAEEILGLNVTQQAVTQLKNRQQVAAQANQDARINITKCYGLCYQLFGNFVGSYVFGPGDGGAYGPDYAIDKRDLYGKSLLLCGRYYGNLLLTSLLASYSLIYFNFVKGH
jgi:hypothetical protein